VATQNLVGVIESRVSGDLARVEGILEFIAQDVPPQQLLPGAAATHGAAMSRRLAALIGRFDDLAVANVFDASGGLLYSSNPAAPQFSMADRPFFKELTSDPKRLWYFTDATVSRSSGQLALILIRNIHDSQGRLVGFASAVINLDAFAGLFASLDVGPGGTTLLHRADNFRQILRNPSLPAAELNADLAADHPVRQRIMAGERAGTLALPAGADGAARMASFVVLQHFPFYLEVAVARSHYLAAWLAQARAVLVVIVLLMLAVGIATKRLRESERRAREAAEKLAENAANFHTFFDGVRDFLFVLDMQGNILYANAHVVEQLGFGAAELRGQSVLMVHPEDRRQEAQQIVHEMLAGRRNACPVPLCSKDGQLIPVETKIVPGRWNGQDALFGVSRDLTALRASEVMARREAEQELRRSNRELEQFSYSISHDMRQPLRMISSYLQLLQIKLGDALDSEHREYFGFAIDGAKRLDTMLLGLLEMSRVGRLGEPAVQVDTRSVLDQALQFLQPLVAEARATIEIEGVWPHLLARPDELLRLMQNLIGNALKFRLTERPPRVLIRSSVDEALWRLDVHDNGVGIAPHQTHRLFQVFQRLQSRARFEGTGIGLALCRKIAEQHGGRIWVESAGEGQGSQFSVEIALQGDAINRRSTHEAA
ncbi:MAG: PAS domain S-box protein, partial [Rhodoferax sp.]|nr:PAS domain S-box protein [Rhodoferax sp.]